MIRAAVLGSPISHSLSPILHRTAYEKLGMLGEYRAIEVQPEELKHFIGELDLSWTGLSLTMPLKEEVLRIADEVDELALRIHSANTLVRSQKGWRALSTDVNGFKQALQAHNVRDFQSVVIIGSGATARAAVAACDAGECKITVVHRNPSREKSMEQAAQFSKVDFLEWGRQLPVADVTINTTPAGVADIYAQRLDSSTTGVFFEALYHPWPSKLLSEWRARSGYGIDGLDLLVHQGIDQVELLTGVAIRRDILAPVLRTACLAAMKS